MSNITSSHTVQALLDPAHATCHVKARNLMFRLHQTKSAWQSQQLVKPQIWKDSGRSIEPFHIVKKVEEEEEDHTCCRHMSDTHKAWSPLDHTRATTQWWSPLYTAGIQQTPDLCNIHTWLQFSSADILKCTLETQIHRKWLNRLPVTSVVITMTLTLISSTHKLAIPSTSILSKKRRIRNAVTGDIEGPKSSEYNMPSGSLANLLQQITES
jgi:hypothetical protein